MIPSVVYELFNQEQLARKVASQLGSTVIKSEQPIDQPHLYLSETGLSFFHPEARSKNKFQIDFNSGSTGWRIKRADHEKLIKIPVKNFPRGIAEITLFNHELVPVTERLLFVNHDQKLYIKAIADKEIYFTKEKVKIKIKVTDDEGNPVLAHLGASVYDKIYDDPEDSKTIEGHFFLIFQCDSLIENCA